MRYWTSPLEYVITSTVGSSEASVRLLRSSEIRPVSDGKGSLVNVWPARPPVSTVPVTGPLTTMNVRSGATVYVNDDWVSLEPAPPRVTGVSGWVTLTERLCAVPVPSPLKVRIPCVLDERVNLPSIGVRSTLNPGGSATRQVPSPVET